jgi:hypothetical protein
MPFLLHCYLENQSGMKLGRRRTGDLPTAVSSSARTE